MALQNLEFSFIWHIRLLKFCQVEVFVALVVAIVLCIWILDTVLGWILLYKYVSLELIRNIFIIGLVHCRPIHDNVGQQIIDPCVLEISISKKVSIYWNDPN